MNPPGNTKRAWVMPQALLDVAYFFNSAVLYQVAMTGQAQPD